VTVGKGDLVAFFPLLIAGLVVAALFLFLAVRIKRARLGVLWLPLGLTAASALTPLLIIGGLPADNYAVLVFIPLTVVYLLYRRPPQRETVTGLFWAIAVLCVAAFAAAISNRLGDMQVIFRFVSFFLMGALVVTLTRRQRESLQDGILWVAAVLALSVCAVGAGLVSLPQVYVDPEAVGERVGGLIGHPNFAAYFLGSAFLVLIANRRLRPLVRFSAIGLITIALLLTGSRGAIAWLVLSAALLFRRGWRSLPAVAVLGAILIPVFGAQTILRFSSIENTGGLSGGNAAGWRLIQWQQALQLTTGHFHLIGIGWSHAVDFLPGRLQVHNGYLQVYVELGWIGVIGLVILIAYLTRAAIPRGLPAIALLVYALTTNISDLVLLYPSATYALLIFLLTTEPVIRRGSLPTESDDPRRLMADASSKAPALSPRSAPVVRRPPPGATGSI
jgi:O-antigen ligase